MARFTDEEIKFITLNYGILSYSEMANTLGCSVNRVKSYRKSHIPTRYKNGKSPFSRSKASPLNEKAFEENLTEGAYWAGFIAADGCIIDKKAGQKSLRIMLQRQDTPHLLKLKEVLLRK